MSRLMTIAAVAGLVLMTAPARGAHPDTCCCYVFTDNKVFCPGCAFSFCACLNGWCPAWTVLCSSYDEPVEHVEGVSLRYDTMKCYLLATCAPPDPEPCIPYIRECKSYGSMPVGVMTFPYAWEACP